MKATIIYITGLLLAALIISSSLYLGIEYGQSQVGCQSVSDIYCGR